MPGVLRRVRGKQRIHNGVRIGQNLLDVVLYRFAIDAHVPRTAVIFCDSGRVDRCVFSERREGVIAGNDGADAGVYPNAPRLMQLCIHFVGALDMALISEVNLSRVLIIGHCCALLPCCAQYRQAWLCMANALPHSHWGSPLSARRVR